jgi:hypothetical protein
MKLSTLAFKERVCPGRVEGSLCMKILRASRTAVVTDYPAPTKGTQANGSPGRFLIVPCPSVDTHGIPGMVSAALFYSPLILRVFGGSSGEQKVSEEK